MLLVLDGQPFQELASIVQQLGDERVWTYAEWIGIKFAPRMQGHWTPGGTETSSLQGPCPMQSNTGRLSASAIQHGIPASSLGLHNHVACSNLHQLCAYEILQHAVSPLLWVCRVP